MEKNRPFLDFVVRIMDDSLRASLFLYLLLLDIEDVSLVSLEYTMYCLSGTKKGKKKQANLSAQQKDGHGDCSQYQCQFMQALKTGVPLFSS